MSLKSTIKGWLGEKFSAFATGLVLDSKIYQRIENIILEDHLGTTQIDRLLVSKYGIFVIEVKDMRGFIYGKSHEKKWIQSFEHRKFKFQNPMHQNFRHIKALAAWLDLPEYKFHSLIHFGPDCVFKSNLPESVRNSAIKPYIQSFQEELLSDSKVHSIVDKIKQQKKDQVSTREHIASLKERYGSTTNCPKCGEALIERNGKHGPFLGCSSFPKCKYTRAVAKG